MATKPRTIGPWTWKIVEDLPIELALRLLGARESAGEQDLCLPNSGDGRGECDVRQAILAILTPYDSETLRPVEQRCRRVAALAEGKGVTSLDTVVRQRLDDRTLDHYDSQPDALCRSAWVYIEQGSVFEDAESFHVVRQFRDNRKLYDAFETAGAEGAIPDASGIDETALAERVSERLGLKTACTVRCLGLPATEHYPASVMVIVRHGGPLSSVSDHRDDGRRGTIYYRPPNETTLIHTPERHLIEICGDSPPVRQTVSECFAQTILGQDLSSKPLTWKHYDLSRFRASLMLPIPAIDGYEIWEARVVEIGLRLGDQKRRLTLKVAIEDNIAAVAERYLGPGNVIARAEGIDRIVVAVRYAKTGEGRKRSLNIVVSGSNRSNLQSNKDPDERNLGYALLTEWGILSRLQTLASDELMATLPQLIALFDRPEDEVSGEQLSELGLDAGRLIRAGLLERMGRPTVILDSEGGETEIGPSAVAGMMKATGPFGEDAGLRPAADLERYRLQTPWLQETISSLIKPLLAWQTGEILDQDLISLGAMRIDGSDVPIYLGRNLDDAATINRLDLLLRGRSHDGVGIVLAAGRSPLSCLGANVVVGLLEHLEVSDDHTLSRAAMEQGFRIGRNQAMGGMVPTVVRYEAQTGTLYLPGKPSLPLVGANQIQIFERLVEAYNRGASDVKVSRLLEGTNTKSLKHAFPGPRRDGIFGVYITKGARNGYWRLTL